MMKTSRTLHDYAVYVHWVREYAKNMPIEDAVERAIAECIQTDILREFLEKNRAEAKAMTIFEYNEEEHMRMEREDAFEDGREAGRAEERENAERERKRAEAAEERAEAAEERAGMAETEIRRLREENERLKNVISIK